MKYATAITIAVCLVGCGENNPRGGVITGNGLVAFEMKLASAVVPPETVDQQGTAFAFGAARANVERVKLELVDGTYCADLDVFLESPVACADETDSGELIVQGPFVIDLFTGVSTPSLAEVTLPAADYQHAEVRFEPARVQDGILADTDPMIGMGLEASGSFDYQAASTNFGFALPLSGEVSFQTLQQVSVGEDRTVNLSLQLNTDSWFGELSITDCLDSGDLTLSGGELILQNGTGACENILEGLEDAILESGSLEEADEEP